MAIFADVQYCISADIVSGWVGGSEKAQNCDVVIQTLTAYELLVSHEAKLTIC